MLQMDEATHTYAIDGERIPSVTQVLSDLLPRSHYPDEWYLQRGSAVHACAAMIAQGLEFDYDPRIEPQVRSIRQFFAEMQPEVLTAEHAVHSRKHGYAGTLDLLATLRDKLTLVDYKASESKHTPYQMAAYAIAYAESHDTTEPRWGITVELPSTGKYRLHTYDLRRYRSGWLALLGAYKIRRECGIGENA